MFILIFILKQKDEDQLEDESLFDAALDHVRWAGVQECGGC